MAGAIDGKTPRVAGRRRRLLLSNETTWAREFIIRYISAEILC